MKIVLLKNIDKIGNKYETKEVKAGFARNFLIPKGFAKKADKEVLRWAEAQKMIEAKRSEENLKKLQEIVSKISGRELVFELKIGEKKQLFETITVQKILDRLKKEGFKIKKSQIDLSSPIKEIGEFPVKIHFEHGLESEVKIITKEKKE